MRGVKHNASAQDCLWVEAEDETKAVMDLIR